MSGISRVLVTGSESWDDRLAIREALAAVWNRDAVLVSDAHPCGAVMLAEACWSHWGGHVERHPANRKRYGRSAEMVRNLEVINLGADRCLAFIGDASPEVTHLAQLAENAGIPTKRIVPVKIQHSAHAADLAEVPAEDERSARAVLTRITDIPHMAEHARRLGQTDRWIWVDRPTPPLVRTPDREAGQWLKCGEHLPDSCICRDEPGRPRRAGSSALADHKAGSALAEATALEIEHEGMDR
ncbi:hypothetical protein AB0L82_26195 [Nocardia sp. NPDC052001]|uniref:hypothetical protein n=1 Tax=Nocardia sp. NPDC052001 TaxID=3154853 RepID=UPI0034275824